MKTFPKILIGSASLAMIAGAAAPAAAQTPYGGYDQGYNQGGGVIGQVINSVLGGGRYGAYGQGQDRIAVDQCARAAEARVSARFQGNGYNGYNGYPQGYGNQGYNGYSQARARVVGITRVERKQNGLKISGIIDSGLNQGAYGNSGYGYGTPGYQQGYPQGYPNQGYPASGYGNPYGNQAYGQAMADLRFNCRVDYRGRVTDLDVRRNNGRRI